MDVTERDGRWKTIGAELHGVTANGAVSALSYVLNNLRRARRRRLPAVARSSRRSNKRFNSCNTAAAGPGRAEPGRVRQAAGEICSSSTRHDDKVDARSTAGQIAYARRGAQAGRAGTDLLHCSEPCPAGGRCRVLVNTSHMPPDPAINPTGLHCASQWRIHGERWRRSPLPPSPR